MKALALGRSGDEHGFGFARVVQQENDGLYFERVFVLSAKKRVVINQRQLLLVERPRTRWKGLLFKGCF